MQNAARNLLIISAIVVSLFGALSFYLASQDYVADSVIFDTSKNIAINGYDTVAYYQQKRPIIGDPQFQAEWAGSIWFFSNVENRDLFVGAPANYAPQYGGYDPLGVSKGYTNPTNPEIYTLLAGQLYLHYSPEYREHWQNDRATNMILANSNWAFLRDQLLSIQNAD